MSLSESDLTQIEYSNVVDHLIRKLNKEDLLQVVQEWFKIPELRPQGTISTWEDYAALQSMGKVKIVDRITTVDWPDGLSVLQCAQLDMKYLIPHASIKVWKAWKLQSGKYPKSMNVSLDMYTIRDRMEEYLNMFYKCHVYVLAHKSETHWYRITLFENRRSKKLPPTTNNAYIVHYPDTEYLLNGGGLKSDMKDYIVKAILHAFGAESIHIQNLTSKRLDTLAEMVLNRKSLGVFSQFRNNTVDANPLDIRQSSAKRGAEYVQTREEKRRIVPVDKAKMEARYKEAGETFGFYPVPGVESLEINLSLPMVLTNDTSQAPGTDNDVEMLLHLKGTNVMQGLRDLMLRGIVEPPLPLWMTELVSAGTNKVFVTRDGILREEIVEGRTSDDEDSTPEQDPVVPMTDE